MTMFTFDTLNNSKKAICLSIRKSLFAVRKPRPLFGQNPKISISLMYSTLDQLSPTSNHA